MARKILLADDSVTAQNMGRKILADAGYEVLTVNNGSAALKKIAEAKPELIVLDVYMPGYSGLEVCQRLKEAQETSRIPVLLTVGKLEPFKPEEAKRVRADGFIVKPFEASELLSALSKLEDKIVPRPEAAKPGRFARANAAIDEGRYDKTVVIEEDSGWKNRIAFPSKKKKATEQEDGDDPAIYNAVNKDLRTVVEHKPPAKLQEAKPETEKVNLEALAPEGLPKDVTPEEIAALAAAAAQVKGKIAESRVAEPAEEHPAAPQLEASHTETKRVEEKTVEAKPIEAQTEAAHDAKEATVTVEAPKEAEATTAQTVAEQRPEEKVEASTEKSSDAAQEPNLPTPNPAEVIAAISALEPETGTATAAHSGNGLGSHEPKDEPVTMAVAAGAEYAVAASRWTAVPVALAPDEVAVSLEHEMQKAYAAFAAAEFAHSAPIAETQPVCAEAVAVAEPAPPVEALEEQSAHALMEPEVVQTASAVAMAATDAISAAVRELEAVAASYEARRTFSSPVSEPTPEPAVEAVVPPAPEPTPIVEAGTEPSTTEREKAEQTTTEEKTEENPAADLMASHPEPVAESLPEPVQQEHHEEHKHEEPAPVAEVDAAVAEPTPEIAEEEEKIEIAVPSDASEVAADHSASPVSSDLTEPALPGEPVAGATKDMRKKESEIAETTAAAWASWRRIRESGDGKHAQPGKLNVDAEEESPRDAAAMAVAAGAEKAPEETPAASDADSGEIASIVDSVLAEMRPKIVAEISKKMGKKK